MDTIIFSLLPFILIILFVSIKQINQYERGIVLMFGKYHVTKQPGWRLVVPLIQSMSKVDIRIRAVAVPKQDAISKDNIPLAIDAVVYYKVSIPEKAILEVENFFYAVSQLAQITMRNIVGQITLDELLKNLEEVANKIQAAVDKATEPWGIEITHVDLKDIVIPENLKRVIAKEAEAEREKRASIIRSQGEVLAAENITTAATMLAKAPGGLHLRTLQSINDIASDQSNTTIWMVPIEALRALEGVHELLQANIKAKKKE